MRAAIRNLWQTVDTLIDVVTRAKGRFVNPGDVAIRIEEAFLSWANLRPELHRGNVDPAVVDSLVARLDDLFTSLIRLTTGAASKRSYQKHLDNIRQLVVGELNDLGIRATLLPLPMPSPTTSRLIPEISDLPSELVPRSLLGWLPQIRRFLEEFPFENNVFIMVAYRARLEPLITAIRAEVERLELNPVIARDCRLTDDLYNPIACLLCCKYGIAIFDRGEAGQKHNANVVYELAVMQTLKRSCVLLKNHQVASMPSDFLHRLYEPYKTSTDAVSKVKAWLQGAKSETGN